jgi:hypothetical protein
MENQDFWREPIRMLWDGVGTFRLFDVPYCSLMPGSIPDQNSSGTDGGAIFERICPEMKAELRSSLVGLWEGNYEGYSEWFANAGTYGS